MTPAARPRPFRRVDDLALLTLSLLAMLAYTTLTVVVGPPAHATTGDPFEIVQEAYTNDVHGDGDASAMAPGDQRR